MISLPCKIQGIIIFFHAPPNKFEWARGSAFERPNSCTRMNLDYSLASLMSRRSVFRDPLSWAASIEGVGDDCGEASGADALGTGRHARGRSGDSARHGRFWGRGGRCSDHCGLLVPGAPFPLVAEGIMKKFLLSLLSSAQSI